MNDAHLHLVVNHFPIIGTIFGLGLLIAGLIFKNQTLKNLLAKGQNEDQVIILRQASFDTKKPDATLLNLAKAKSGEIADDQEVTDEPRLLDDLQLDLEAIHHALHRPLRRGKLARHLGQKIAQFIEQARRKGVE